MDAHALGLILRFVALDDAIWLRIGNNFDNGEFP